MLGSTVSEDEVGKRVDVDDLACVRGSARALAASPLSRLVRGRLHFSTRGTFLAARLISRDGIMRVSAERFKDPHEDHNVLLICSAPSLSTRVFVSRQKVSKCSETFGKAERTLAFGRRGVIDGPNLRADGDAFYIRRGPRQHLAVAERNFSTYMK